MQQGFADRRAAGRLLGVAVRRLGIGPEAVVLGLPRGGVPVAQEVAAALGAPMDVLLVRKIGVPGQPELAAGAVADGEAPTTVFNREVLEQLGLTEDDLAEPRAHALAELRRREMAFRAARAALPIVGRTVVVVDDGLATGSTARAAGLVLRQRGAAKLVLAVPVAPADTIEEMQRVYDAVLSLLQPRPFWSVGAHYADFTQVRDDEVVEMLRG